MLTIVLKLNFFRPVIIYHCTNHVHVIFLLFRNDLRLKPSLVTEVKAHKLYML